MAERRQKLTNARFGTDNYCNRFAREEQELAVMGKSQDMPTISSRKIDQVRNTCKIRYRYRVA